MPSPRLLSAGAEMAAAGMSLPAVLDLAERLRVPTSRRPISQAAPRDGGAAVTAAGLAWLPVTRNWPPEILAVRG